MRNLIVVCFCLQFALLSYAQPPAGTAAAKWVRVASDNGDLSLEVPDSYKYYFNKEGFLASHIGTSTMYQFRDMRLVTGFLNGTLVSMESYRAGKGALDALYESDIRNKAAAERSDLRSGGEKIRQVVLRDDKSYMVRRYLSLDSGIYILTAASRSGETPEIRHFLDSVSIKTKDPQPASVDEVTISSLKMTEVAIEMALIDDEQTGPRPPAPRPTVQAPAPAAAGLVVLSKPLASYTNEARQRNVKGAIRLRVTFAEDGFVPHIAVLKTLEGGLLRQALLAAMRIKFLPAEKDGKPQSVRRMMEYTFSIY